MVRFQCRRNAFCASRLSKRASLQRVVFDVAAAALLLAVFLRRARLRRQRREAPVLREREIDLVTVGIVEARAHDRGFEIVVANDARDAAEVAERALMQPQERLELLIPDRFFVAMARVAQRHAKHPRPSPLARRRVERRRAAEEIDLRLPRRARSERRRRPGASARSSARSASPTRSWRRSRTPRPGPARCAAGSDRRRVSRRSPSRYTAAVNRGRGVEPGNVLAGFASEPANVLAAFDPSTSGRSRDSAGGDGSEPGNVLAAFARRMPVVRDDRLATDAGLRFDAPVAPAELEQGENLLISSAFSGS